MSECKWAGSERPRMLPGRHEEACADDHCRGCQPCTEPHCRICGMAHSVGTCAECMAETRGNLREIGRMCHALPEEVEHRGIDGEAMMLLGPTSDPEAWGHVGASLRSGRLVGDDDWLQVADNELHPLFVLGTWEMVWRDSLEHRETDTLTLAAAVDYLDRTMSLMGGHEHVPFEDFARDLRNCVSRLESVLHDGEQHDTGAPCMSCGRPLERVWGKDSTADGWRCTRCNQRSTEDQYRFAVMHLHREEAEWLTDRDMAIRTGVKAGTIRSWSRPTHDREALVRKRRDSERTVYSVADVERTAREKGMLAA